MIDVTCEVDVLQINRAKNDSEDVLIIRSHGLIGRDITLIFRDLTLVVNASDLKRAIDNATNA